VCSVVVVRPLFLREVCIRAKGGDGRGKSGETLCHDTFTLLGL